MLGETPCPGCEGGGFDVKRVWTERVETLSGVLRLFRITKEDVTLVVEPGFDVEGLRKLGFFRLVYPLPPTRFDRADPV